MENKITNDWAIDLLCEILSCDKETVKGLATINYPWKEVSPFMSFMVSSVSEILEAAFTCGLEYLTEDIKKRYEELAQKQMDGTLTGDEFTEMVVMSSLNPYDDISFKSDENAGKIETLLFLENEDLYRRYLTNALRDMEDGLGCEFEG